MRKITLLALLATMVGAQGVSAQIIDTKVAEPFSPYVFTYNLEHTRAAVNGGLSAQMLRNRKFAGKPSRNEGLAAHWFPIGEKTLYLMGWDRYGCYTHHICLDKMSRINELNAQLVENLVEGQLAGMGQHEVALQAGKPYLLRTVTRVNKPISLRVELTDRYGKQVYAIHTLSLSPSDDWHIDEFELTPAADDMDGCIRYTFNSKAEIAFGALSMLPKDNFHGMRPDVVRDLKAIGPRMLRWPGGNFAGEYRWKDGLLPVDERGPLQAATEIETQPYSDGYDYHEIGTDEFVALCREVGAEPWITINAAWSTPEESAQWVEYCNGAPDTEYGKMRADRGFTEPYNVRFWSLGNEMGYGHMEGPRGPQEYAALAEQHADAMLKVTPDLEFCSSGPYPNKDWVENSAAPLAEKVPYISLHTYCGPQGGFHYTSEEDTRQTYEGIIASSDGCLGLARRMREMLDESGKKLHISFDEWNQWYAWYRPSCVGEGMFTAKVMHMFLRETNALDMPIVSYFQPVGEGAILITPAGSRLTANGQIFALMKVHQDALLCKVAEDDDYSTVASLKGDTLTITLINTSYDRECAFDFALKGKLLQSMLYSSDDVTAHSYFNESSLQVEASGKKVHTVLPPHSVGMIQMKIK